MRRLAATSKRASVRPAAASRPAVSVVVPTRGRRGYLNAALASALAQTASVLEVIVVDDEPSPSAPSPVPADRRIRLLTSYGAGAAAARNVGWLAARGEVVAFLDDDDVWEPTKLERQLQELADRPEIELVYCAFRRVVDETGEEIPRRPLRALDLGDLLRSTPFGCSIPVVRRRALAAVDGFDESLSATHDRDLWLRLRRRAPFAYVDEVLATVRLHRDQMSGDLERKIGARRRILAKHAADYRRDPEALAHQLGRLGMMEAVACRRWRAVACFVEAMRWDRRAPEPRRLLRESLLTPERQRGRLLEEVFGRPAGIVHYW
jgi:glycosyltransferase involved in cell wall biosynthesis